MNATEIAIYAVETKAIIHVLWGLLLIASISLIGVSITYALLRVKLRSGRRRESQLARQVAAKTADVKRLEERIASVAEIEGGVESMKAELRRAQALRGKSEQRLVAQNAELDALREQCAERDLEIGHLRALVEHASLAQPGSAKKAA